MRSQPSPDEGNETFDGYLYKYGKMHPEHSEALFTTNEVFFQSPENLNDPFECSPHYTFDGTKDEKMPRMLRIVRQKFPNLSEALIQQKAERLFKSSEQDGGRIWNGLSAMAKQRFHESIGLYCLSERRDYVLMWSHYADSHQGFCLQFDAFSHEFFSGAQIVKYSKDYPTIEFFRTSIEEQVELALLTKSKDWEYEVERRVVNYTKGSGLHSYPKELLTGVTFGLNMPEADKKKIREWVSPRGTDVKFYQAEQSKMQFALSFEEAT